MKKLDEKSYAQFHSSVQFIRDHEDRRTADLLLLWLVESPVAKKSTVPVWSVTNLDSASYVGTLEFQDNTGEYYNFEVMQNETRLIFGGAVNTGFLESGYIVREDGETTEDTWQELLSDLEVFYNDGARHVSRIVCNERM